jgi:hypothetical protein|tara:strand:- start:142 stop:369 length:228 start_codon:yes stop_codon:yes gene_type:complete
MLNEKEIKNLMKQLENLMEAVSEPTISRVLSDDQKKILYYFKATYESLSWVLGYIDTNDFKSEYIQIHKLESLLE